MILMDSSVFRFETHPVISLVQTSEIPRVLVEQHTKSLHGSSTGAAELPSDVKLGKVKL